jgi:hypothetical protein
VIPYIKANGELPEIFNTDIFTQGSNFRFDKGSNVFLSNNILTPSFYSLDSASYGVENARLRITSEKGTINLDYVLPANVDYNKLKFNILKTIESFKNGSTKSL